MTSQYGHAQSGSVHTPPYSGVENYFIRLGGDNGFLRVVRIREEGGVDHVVRAEVDEVQFCFSSVHVKMSELCFNFI